VPTSVEAGFRLIEANKALFDGPAVDDNNPLAKPDDAEAFLTPSVKIKIVR
jgi:hypothetical protein